MANLKDQVHWVIEKSKFRDMGGIMDDYLGQVSTELNWWLTLSIETRIGYEHSAREPLDAQIESDTNG